MKLSFLLVAAALLCAALFSSVFAASCYTTFDAKDLFGTSINMRKGKSGFIVQNYQLKNEYTDIDFSTDGSLKPIIRFQPQGSCSAAVVKAFTDVKDMRMYVTIHKNLQGKYVAAQAYGETPVEIDADILAKIADTEVTTSLSITPEENVIYLANLQCGKTDKKIVKFTFPRVMYQNLVTLRWDVLEDTRGPSECSAQEDDEGQTSSASIVIGQVQIMMVALFGSTSALWVMTVVLSIFVGCLLISSCILCCVVGCNKRKRATENYGQQQQQQYAPTHGTVQFVPAQPQYQVVGSEKQPLYPPQMARSTATI